MNIIDKEKYQQQYIDRTTGQYSLIYELWLPMLLFGSMGAITWAIRGTAGWGGVDGTVLPGMMWGVLWYYLAYRKGIDARSIVLWLGLGIALGGELGYGQYVSWIRGIFYVGDTTIAIDPWLGYFWFTLCGIGWAAPGGILLGWALGKNVSPMNWLYRVLLLVALLVLLFAWPVIDWISAQLMQHDSSWLYPNAHMGLIHEEIGEHLSRMAYTNTQNFAVVVWWLGALLVALWQRDRTTLITGLIIGGGFGLGFMQSALWVLGYGIDPGYVDWWKIWELNSGFNLGVLYAIALYWAIREVDKGNLSDRKTATVKGINRPLSIEWRDTLFLAVGGFVLLFFVGFEYFFWTGISLSLFYFVTMCFTTNSALDSFQIAERRKNISLTFSIFLLVFLMLHGGSERMGIVLGLYNEDAVNQYSWPIERIVLFVPAALVLTSIAVWKMHHILSQNTLKARDSSIPSKLSLRIIDLIVGMGFIGALSIWPAKISILYALFLMFAIFAFNRLERRLNRMDIPK